jgi:hypothetical protein
MRTHNILTVLIFVGLWNSNMAYCGDPAAMASAVGKVQVLELQLRLLGVEAKAKVEAVAVAKEYYVKADKQAKADIKEFAGMVDRAVAAEAKAKASLDAAVTKGNDTADLAVQWKAANEQARLWARSKKAFDAEIADYLEDIGDVVKDAESALAYTQRVVGKVQEKLADKQATAIAVAKQ